MLTLTLVEVLKARGEGGHHAQAVCGYCWVLMSLVKELFLEAFLIPINTGAKAIKCLGAAMVQWVLLESQSQE